MAEPPHEPEPILKVQNLCLRFGKVQKLHDCSFCVNDGEIFGLLGQNGSGKSSIIKSVLGLIGSSGEIGFSCEREEVAYVPQHFAFFPEYSVEENLKFFSRLADKRTPIDLLAEEFDLAQVRHVRAANLSGGYKRLLNMAIAMVRPARLVILDEPTANMDVMMRRRIMEVVERIRNTGASVVLTTHYMDEAERHCDRVAMVVEGKIAAVGTVDDIVGRYGGSYSVDASCDTPSELSALLKKSGFLPIALPGRVRVEVPSELGNQGIVRAMKIYSKFRISHMAVNEPSLAAAMERLFKNA